MTLNPPPKILQIPQDDPTIRADWQASTSKALDLIVGTCFMLGGEHCQAVSKASREKKTPEECFALSTIGATVDVIADLVAKEKEEEEGGAEIEDKEEDGAAIAAAQEVDASQRMASLIEKSAVMQKSILAKLTDDDKERLVEARHQAEVWVKTYVSLLVEEADQTKMARALQSTPAVKKRKDSC